MEQRLIHTPEGVRDIYGAELARRKDIAERMLKALKLYGCREIETPVFEYFDIYSKETGTTPSRELYKFFDREGDTLVLRPDLTPPAARCAVKYFLDGTDSVRLCYSGKVFQNTLNLQGKLKETTQIGAEIMGEPSTDADAEILAMAAETLRAAGFEEFTISMGDVDFFKGLCEEAGLSGENILKLREYISIKNYYGAAQMLEHRNVDRRISELMINAGDVVNAADLSDIREATTSKKAVAALDRLIKIYSLMEKKGLGRYISIDLGMLSKFNYYTGLIFRAYTYGAPDAIVKGGRYDGLLASFGKDVPATGCVFLLDDIMSALRDRGQKTTEEEIQRFEYNEDNREEVLSKVAGLRAEGIPAYGVFKGK